MKVFAKMKKIFDAEDMKKSKKKDALKKALSKLEKKHAKLQSSIKSGGSRKKLKDLEHKLATNRRHLKKARKLIKEID